MRKYKGAGIALFQKQDNDYAILLGKRTIKPNKDKWSIPGGGFEKTDNSLFETAIRELREETGINLSNSVNEKKAIICSFHYPCFEWKTFMFEVASDFHVPERLCYEFSEIKLIYLKDIHQYKLAFGVRKEIKKFLISFFPRAPKSGLRFKSALKAKWCQNRSFVRKQNMCSKERF